jgi:lactose/L-arabinose transport system substrate-binding protein
VGNENDIVPTMMRSAGTWFFDDQGNVNIANNAVLKEAVKQYKAMIDAGIVAFLIAGQ